jgi:hypothetical protein
MYREIKNLPIVVTKDGVGIFQVEHVVTNGKKPEKKDLTALKKIIGNTEPDWVRESLEE